MQPPEERMGPSLLRICLILLSGISSGCAAYTQAYPVSDAPHAGIAPGANATCEQPCQGLALASYHQSPSASATQHVDNLPFPGQAVLDVEELIDQVLARNPSLTQAVAVRQAAAARYPQVISLEDPMLAATIGPGTFSPDDSGVEFAYRIEVSQKLPYPGKLRLRGENALAEASAAERDVDDVRLQLVQSARMAFYDYFLVERALEVNEDSLRLLRDFRKNAQTRYQTALVPEQDVLQADVEIGKEQDRRLELTQMRQVAIARINTLMHLSPDSTLPPTPKQLDLKEEVPDAQTLRQMALVHRPDLQALADRIAAEEALLGLAHKEFYPDFEPFVMYDRFMGNVSDNRDLATQLGIKVNLPIYKQRRYGAISEAEARVAQRKAELARLTDQVNYDVQEAYAKVERSEKSVRLYADTILRAAEANVKAAQAAYTTGKVPFLSLIEAQRNEVGLRDRYYEALADYFRRRAVLERAVGGPLTQTGSSNSSK
jgi:outer membrane protein TolC